VKVAGITIDVEQLVRKAVADAIAAEVNLVLRGGRSVQTEGETVVIPRRRGKVADPNGLRATIRRMASAGSFSIKQLRKAFPKKKLAHINAELYKLSRAGEVVAIGDGQYRKEAA
jgi:hypothetical protein